MCPTSQKVFCEHVNVIGGFIDPLQMRCELYSNTYNLGWRASKFHIGSKIVTPVA